MARTTSTLREATTLLEIVKRLSRNRLITLSEIQQSLDESGIHVPSRTLQRYMKTLVETDFFGVECDTRSRPYGYRRNATGSDLGNVALTPSESLMLLLVKDQLHYLLPTHVTNGLGHLFEAAKKTINELAISKKNDKDWLTKIAVIPQGVPQMPAKILPRVFEAVSEALYKNRKLEVSYRNNEGKKFKSTVSPLALIEQEARLYLVVVFDGFDDIRHLVLHRIESAKITDFERYVPKDFSLKRYLASRHFNYGGNNQVLWSIEFTEKSMAQNLQETPFNPTQTIKKLKNGHFLLEVKIQDSKWLDAWGTAFKDIAGIRRMTKKALH